MSVKVGANHGIVCAGRVVGSNGEVIQVQNDGAAAQICANNAKEGGGRFTALSQASRVEVLDGDGHVWKGLVSHLAAGVEEAGSDALGFWSLSLLLYVGRAVGDLMSSVVDWDGDEVVAFEVDDRSSMLPVRCQ